MSREELVHLQVPVSKLSASERYNFYFDLHKRSKGRGGGENTITIDQLIEWDEIRLKLFPKAPQLYVERSDDNGEGEADGRDNCDCLS